MSNLLDDRGIDILIGSIKSLENKCNVTENTYTRFFKLNDNLSGYILVVEDIRRNTVADFCDESYITNISFVIRPSSLIPDETIIYELTGNINGGVINSKGNKILKKLDEVEEAISLKRNTTNYELIKKELVKFIPRGCFIS